MMFSLKTIFCSVLKHFKLLRNKPSCLGALSAAFFLEENQKILLVDFTRVMLINLSLSLLVSLFLVPALMANLYHKEPAPPGIRIRKRVIWLTGYNHRFILFEKRYKWAFIVLAIVGFGLPVWMLPGEMEGEGYLE